MGGCVYISRGALGEYSVEKVFPFPFQMIMCMAAFPGREVGADAVMGTWCSVLECIYGR